MTTRRRIGPRGTRVTGQYHPWPRLSVLCILLGALCHTGQTVSGMRPGAIPTNESVQLLEKETGRVDDLGPRHLAETRVGESGCKNATIGDLEDVSRFYPQPSHLKYFRVSISNPNDVPIRYLLLLTPKPMQYLLTPSIRLFNAIKLPTANYHVFLYRVKPWNQAVALMERQKMDLYFAYEEVKSPWSMKVYANYCA